MNIVLQELLFRGSQCPILQGLIRHFFPPGTETFEIYPQPYATTFLAVNFSCTSIYDALCIIFNTINEFRRPSNPLEALELLKECRNIVLSIFPLRPSGQLGRVRDIPAIIAIAWQPNGRFVVGSSLRLPQRADPAPVRSARLNLLRAEIGPVYADSHFHQYTTGPAKSNPPGQCAEVFCRLVAADWPAETIYITAYKIRQFIHTAPRRTCRLLLTFPFTRTDAAAIAI